MNRVYGYFTGKHYLCEVLKSLKRLFMNFVLPCQQKDSFSKAMAKKTQLKNKAIANKKKANIIIVPKTKPTSLSQDSKTTGDLSWEVVELSQGSQSSQKSQTR